MFSLSQACDKSKKIFLYFLAELKIYHPSYSICIENDYFKKGKWEMMIMVLQNTPSFVPVDNLRHLSTAILFHLTNAKTAAAIVI